MTRPSRNRPGSSELLNGDDIWRKCDRGKSDDAYTWLELGRHPGLRLRCGGHPPQLDRSGAESACGCSNYTLKSTEASKIPVFRVHSTVRTFGTLRGLIQWSADEFAPQSASGFVVPSPSRSCITATPRSRCFGRRSFSAAASARSVSSIGALSSPAGSCETNARFQQNLSLQHRPWTSEAGRLLPDRFWRYIPAFLVASKMVNRRAALPHCQESRSSDRALP